MSHTVARERIFIIFSCLTSRKKDLFSWWISGSGDRILNISGGPINSGPQSSGHSELQTRLFCPWRSVPDPWHIDVDPDPDPRIHASDYWIRILDPNPAIFVIDLEEATIKKCFNKFFCLLVFEGAFTSFFKDKKSKRSHKTVGTNVFLTIFACW